MLTEFENARIEEILNSLSEEKRDEVLRLLRGEKGKRGRRSAKEKRGSCPPPHVIKSVMICDNCQSKKVEYFKMVKDKRLQCLVSRRISLKDVKEGEEVEERVVTRRCCETCRDLMLIVWPKEMVVDRTMELLKK